MKLLNRWNPALRHLQARYEEFLFQSVVHLQRRFIMWHGLQCVACMWKPPVIVVMCYRPLKSSIQIASLRRASAKKTHYWWRLTAKKKCKKSKCRHFRLHAFLTEYTFVSMDVPKWSAFGFSKLYVRHTVFGENICANFGDSLNINHPREISYSFWFDGKLINRHS